VEILVGNSNARSDATSPASKRSSAASPRVQTGPCLGSVVTAIRRIIQSLVPDLAVHMADRTGPSYSAKPQTVSFRSASSSPALLHAGTVTRSTDTPHRRPTSLHMRSLRIQPISDFTQPKVGTPAPMRRQISIIFIFT
jgi:hypothetical protein